MMACYRQQKVRRRDGGGGANKLSQEIGLMEQHRRWQRHRVAGGNFQQRIIFQFNRCTDQSMELKVKPSPIPIPANCGGFGPGSGRHPNGRKMKRRDRIPQVLEMFRRLGHPIEAPKLDIQSPEMKQILKYEGEENEKLEEGNGGRHVVVALSAAQLKSGVGVGLTLRRAHFHPITPVD